MRALNRNTSVREGPYSNQAELQGSRRPNRIRVCRSYARGLCSWKVKLQWCPDCSRTAARDCANGNTCGVKKEYWNGSGRWNKICGWSSFSYMAFLLSSGSPFHMQALGGNSQPLVSRWQRRGEGTGKRKSNPKTGRSICWSCSDTVRLPSLCPQSPAIMITCLLQPLHQATSFALARALFSSFSFCSIKFQLKCFLSYCLDHSSPSLCSLWRHCRSLWNSSIVVLAKLLLFNL